RKSRRSGVLQLRWCGDPRPDDRGEDLRPQRPLKAHEPGEREYRDLGGEQAESQWSSEVDGEDHNEEHGGSGPGTESQETWIDPGAERARSKPGAGHGVLRSAGATSPIRCRVLVGETAA